jgi:hypothetical protein
MKKCNLSNGPKSAGIQVGEFNLRHGRPHVVESSIILGRLRTKNSEILGNELFMRSRTCDQFAILFRMEVILESKAE